MTGFLKKNMTLQNLTTKDDNLFIIGDWNVNVGSQETLITGKFGLGVQNEAGRRLTKFCQENTQVIANTLSNSLRIDSARGHYRRRQWHPTPALLPGKSHGWRSLVGHRLWGCTESDTTEATWQQQQQTWDFVKIKVS